jgi:hypothetical protein
LRLDNDELVTSRFYPYFYLGFFEVDSERHPQSLSWRLKKLQDEYGSKRSNSRLTAERSVPGGLFDATGVKSEDVKKIEKSVHQEWVGIESMKGDDIRKLFTEKPVPKIDPLVFDTSSVIADMERVGGVQEALSQAVTVAKTATEAKIQDTGFASRTSADRDSLEDMLQDLAEYTLELAIQGMPLTQAQRIAGPKAFWPEGMAQQDIITLAEIDIVAGTTGKPDEEKERQSWSILLPLIQAIMKEIQLAQLTGNLPMAIALRELLAETFRRLDERVPVDKFVPQGELADLSVLANMLGEFTGGGAGGRPAAPDAGPKNAADANTL